MVNFWRTTLSCILGTLFWLWTGWTSGSGAMVMIAVVTSLAMRLPNPRMVAIDFIYGTLAALPLGLLYFLVIILILNRACCCCVLAWQCWDSSSV